MLRYISEKINVNLDDIEIKDRFGDFSFNIKKIAKKYGIDENLAREEISKKLSEIEFIKNFEEINSFFNVYLDWKKVIPFLAKREIENVVIANKILVEHTSANPNKALHVGHLRNACLGDSIYRLLKKLGNKVYAATYVDDTGAQMAELLIAFKYLNKPMDVEEKFDLYCSKLYAEANKLIKEDANLQKLKSIIVKELENENSFTFELNKKIVEKVLRAQLETLWYFDIFFDFINKESDILAFDLWKLTFEKLKELNKIEFVEENKEIVEKLDDYSSSLIKKKAGTYVIKSKNTMLVLIRSDGTLTYLAKDIAYAFWKHSLIPKSFLFSEFLTQPNGKKLFQTNKYGKKIEEFENFDVSINVIGREQAENQYVIQNLISEISNKKYVYYSYGLVFLSEKVAKELGFEAESHMVKMSGRKGLVVNVDDLIKKFEEKVKEVLKSRDIEDSSLIKKITRSCIRYEMVKLDKDKDSVFDFDEALNIEGNSAVYLMYTYARIMSILRRLNFKVEVKDFDVDLNDYEKNLAKKLLEFDIVLNSITKSFEISKLANYVFKLSQIFNLFYENCRIIDEKDEEKKKLRLNLLLATKKVLDFAFEVLGIDKVDKI